MSTIVDVPDPENPGQTKPEILSSFVKGKIQNGFVDRWLFAYPEKAPVPQVQRRGHR